MSPQLGNGQIIAVQDMERMRVLLWWKGNHDCDLVLALTAQGRQEETVWREQPSGSSGALHRGKEYGLRNGSHGEVTGLVKLSLVPPHITKIPVGVVVHNGATFGDLRDVLLTVQNADTGVYLEWGELDPMFAGFPAGKVGEFGRIGDGWQFVVCMQPYASSEELFTHLSV